jgi:putative hemolysin
LHAANELPSPTGPLLQMLSFVNSPAKPRTHLPNLATKPKLSAKIFEFTRKATMPWVKASAFKSESQSSASSHTPLSALQASTAQAPIIPAAHETLLGENAYTAHWASSPEEVRAAQALRWQVFAGEMGAKLNSPVQGLDIDPFDWFCEHLLVKDATGAVVGTYRALLPEQAELACGWYSSTEFYLKPLLPYAERVMEVGRSCVHADHRNGTVMMMLWQELARFMDRQGLDWLFGCVSVPSRADGGRMAASLWQHFNEKQLFDHDVFCKPKTPLDVESLNGSLDAQVVMPPLLKGYLRLGAKIASAPALDEAFGCVDFMIILRKEDIAPRYAKHFFGQAVSSRA